VYEGGLRARVVVAEPAGEEVQHLPELECVAGVDRHIWNVGRGVTIVLGRPR